MAIETALGHRLAGWESCASCRFESIELRGRSPGIGAQQSRHVRLMHCPLRIAYLSKQARDILMELGIHDLLCILSLEHLQLLSSLVQQVRLL